MFGGSNASETTEDSGGSYYSGPGGGKRISAALAARQQRRSMRYSQDSQFSLSGRTNPLDGTFPLSSTAEENGSAEAEDAVGEMVTSKLTKPTVAKVNANQRGPRMVVPGAGPLDEDNRNSSGSGLGIDFSGFTVGDYGSRSSAATRSSFYHSAANQTRRPSSTLNPSHNRGAPTTATTTTHNNNNSNDQQQDNGMNVVLKMPPPPRSGAGTSGVEDNRMNSSRLRSSIIRIGEEMPGFLNYGDDM